MLRRTGLFMLALMPAVLAAGDLEDLKAAQERLNGAFGSLDAGAVAASLHDNCIDFGAEADSPQEWSGKSGGQRLQYFEDLFAKYQSWQVRFEEAHYQVTGDTGIVCGIENVGRQPKNGRAESRRWRFTTTWLKSNGKWTVIASHHSTFPATAPGGTPLAKNDAEKRILDTAIATPRFANVPLADARLLRVLAEAIGAKQIVELGTSTGYSGLWFCDALRATGGKLTTFEIDPGRVATAHEQFRRAGVDDLVVQVVGDAHKTLGALKGPVDLVFIDAEKPGYPDYLRQVLPLVRPGGIILAHNMRWPDPSQEYVKAVTTDPDLETIFVNMDDQGIGITLKKR